ncbi:hypothetical protein R2F61_03955 [Mollicutes bacterium LVI A0078]|nr:hypothetical protein RZE84_03975 [Mollicutes bacterium LVI A0075]WOO91717.1 hypothetical protein R2F61_03955 [Mollicutes bacterium LVI A0078]
MTYLIAKGILVAGAAAAAAAGVAALATMMLPFEVGALTVFAVGSGVVTTGKMWKNGNSATGSFVGGTVVGVATFAGEIDNKIKLINEIINEITTGNFDEHCGLENSKYSEEIETEITFACERRLS